MIDMDYEKKYKDALSRARSMYESQDDAELAAYIFPELCESKDERIKKAIVHILYENYSDAAVVEGVEIAEIVAWLEKQKENPKPADSIPSDCVSDAKCEDKSPKHSDSDGTDIRDTPAYWKGWDDAMKQKEQKHPNGCFTCDEYKIGYESGRLNGFTAGYNKAMKEIDQKEQQPAEWSEEDERIVNNIVSVLGQYIDYKSVSGTGSGYATPRYTKEIDWLKSLRPKPKQDKGPIAKFVQAVEDAEQRRKGHEEGLRDGMKRHWKPSEVCYGAKGDPDPAGVWKPSEEQMEAFRSYIKDFQEKAEAAVGGWNNFDVMIRLFEQLKKLM